MLVKKDCPLEGYPVGVQECSTHPTDTDQIIYTHLDATATPSPSDECQREGGMLCKRHDARRISYGGSDTLTPNG